MKVSPIRQNNCDDSTDQSQTGVRRIARRRVFRRLRWNADVFDWSKKRTLNYIVNPHTKDWNNKEAGKKGKWNNEKKKGEGKQKNDSPFRDIPVRWLWGRPEPRGWRNWPGSRGTTYFFLSCYQNSFDGGDSKQVFRYESRDSVLKEREKGKTGYMKE